MNSLTRNDIEQYMDYMYAEDKEITICIKCDEDYINTTGEIEIFLENYRSEEHPCILFFENALLAIEQSYTGEGVYSHDAAHHLIPYNTIRILSDNY